MSNFEKQCIKEDHDVIQGNLNDMKYDHANNPNTTNGDIVIYEILSRLYRLIKGLKTDLNQIRDYQDKIVEWGQFY